jgi:hypothetical protein
MAQRVEWFGKVRYVRVNLRVIRLPNPLSPGIPDDRRTFMCFGRDELLEPGGRSARGIRDLPGDPRFDVGLSQRRLEALKRKKSISPPNARKTHVLGSGTKVALTRAIAAWKSLVSTVQGPFDVLSNATAIELPPRNGPFDHRHSPELASCCPIDVVVVDKESQ